jgi:hypothetical protein
VRFLFFCQQEIGAISKGIFGEGITEPASLCEIDETQASSRRRRFLGRITQEEKYADDKFGRKVKDFHGRRELRGFDF